jgi:acyl dehydratase
VGAGSAPWKTELRYDDVSVGTELPSLQADPISRLTLALYCGASGDHNPIHVDSDFARAAGREDVFAHGMLGMGYLARLVTAWVPQHAIRSLSTRFVAITHVGDRITCSGIVVEKLADHQVRLALTAQDQSGIVKLAGEAVVKLAGRAERRAAPEPADIPSRDRPAHPPDEGLT